MMNRWTKRSPRPTQHGASWSAREVQMIKRLAKTGEPIPHVAKKLGRTAAAVQQKALRLGVSFRAAAKKTSARRST